MFDHIKLWEFNTAIENKGSLFVWVLNNKWETNFRTDCAGYLESHVNFCFGQSKDDAVAALETCELDVVVLRTN